MNQDVIWFDVSVQ
jgi:hypothetical protein